MDKGTTGSTAGNAGRNPASKRIKVFATPKHPAPGKHIELHRSRYGVPARAAEGAPLRIVKSAGKSGGHAGTARKAVREGVSLPAFFSTRYKLLGSIGKGGSATVYKAHDKVLNLTVAIKFLPARLISDPKAAARFKQEAITAMHLAHENIVKLHNLEIDRNRTFLVMEYVEGSDFRDIIQQYGTLSLSATLQVVRSCAAALDYAHDHGVLHQDLKPENLMLTADSILKIVDLGTARRIGSVASEAERKYLEGSPPYMSPEQIARQPLDRRTDVYSLGAIVYEFIQGRPPFDIDEDIVTIYRSPTPLLTNCPKSIADVVAKAMAKDRDQRWQTAGEFLAALAAAVEQAHAGTA